MRFVSLFCFALLTISCGGGNSPAPAAKTEVAPPAAAAEKIEPFGRFPKEGLVKVTVVEAHLMGKPFLHAGSLATYAKHEAFVTEFASPTDAAIALLDYKKTMTDAKLVPAFGGYFGKDGERPVFVFTKGKWLAGIAGLGEKAVDLPARKLAAAL